MFKCKLTNYTLCSSASLPIILYVKVQAYHLNFTYWSLFARTVYLATAFSSGISKYAGGHP